MNLLDKVDQNKAIVITGESICIDGGQTRLMVYHEVMGGVWSRKTAKPEMLFRPTCAMIHMQLQKNYKEGAKWTTGP